MKEIELIQFKDEESSYKLMWKWCSLPSIYEWFEQRVLSYNEIFDKYNNKLLDNKQKLFFIKYDKKLIGYVQIYICDDKKYAEDNTFEYDIFIGEEDYQSKGIGTIIVDFVDNYIFSNYKADCIVLRPFKRNIRAIKCYQKNNYKIVNEYNGTDTLGNKEEYVVLKKYGD